MIDGNLQTDIYPEQVDDGESDMAELRMPIIPTTREIISIWKINPDGTSADDETSTQI